MIEQNQFAPAQKSYRPSGKVNFLRFTLLFIPAVCVAGVMAGVLFAIQDFAYYFIITPLLVCLPVFGLSYLIVRLGRCRLPILAAIAGVVLILIYYVGFWTLSYTAFLDYYGRDTQEILKAETGSTGLWGYFLLRCKTGIITETPGITDPNKKPDVSDEILHYAFYGIEFILLLFAGAVVPLNVSRSVFYEGPKKWASVRKIHCRPGDFDLLMQIVKTRDWQKLRELPKLPKAGLRQSPVSLVFKVEFLNNSGDAPAYVSVEGTNLGKAVAAKNAGVKKLGSLSRIYVGQIEILAADLATIAGTLPELGIIAGQVVPAQALQNASTALPVKLMQPVSAPAPLKPSLEYDAGFNRALQPQGISTPGIGGPDFRQKAADESKAILVKYGMVNLADINASFCLPVEDQYRFEPGKMVKLRKRLIFSALGLILLGFLTLFVAAVFDESDQKILILTGKVFLVLALGLMTSGVISLFMLYTIHKLIIKHRLRTRPGSIFDVYAGGPFMLFRLDDSRTYYAQKYTPEDFCLCCIDAMRKRLLIEGCAYRYLVRSEDVLRLAPTESGTKISVDLVWRIGAEQLAVVLSSENTSAHAVNPNLALTAKKTRKLANKMRAGLGLPTL